MDLLLGGSLVLAGIGVGYIAARWQLVDPDSGESATDSSLTSYHRGLYHLLNEQPDQALDAFLDAARVEPETVEIHLALGSLYRRRGEVDRALRIHQNLIARPNLAREQRDNAMYQLGLDYQKAGLLDRAQQVFEELAGGRQSHPAAVEALVEIHEQEREWEEALRWRKVAARLKGEGSPRAESHIYCEMAAEALRSSDLGSAQQAIRKALGVKRDCVRARILAGQLHARRGHDRKAVQNWQPIVHQHPKYLFLVLEEMVAAFHRLEDAQSLSAFLHQGLAQADHPLLIATLAGHIEREEGPTTALSAVNNGLQRFPGSSELTAAYFHTWKAIREPDSCGSLVGVIEPFLDRARQQPAFVCTQCGFKSTYLLWKCPQCRSWGTLELTAA